MTSASFPKGKTAFLVIHGIGEQNPFETLDSFSRGMIEHLGSQGILFKAEHRLGELKDSDGAVWTENYVRLKPPQGDDFIDIHEYYWAYLTEEQIAVSEVWDWLGKTLQGTRNFYRDNVELSRRYEKDGKPRFRLNKVLWYLRLSSLVYPFLKLLIGGLTYIVPSWGRGAADWLKKQAYYIIKGYIGDVAIYTTTDEKSRFYKIRQQILAKSQTLLESILADPQYERVIIAGHSLGSVISYDTLNKINIKSNLAGSAKLPIEKIRGLVTFGSPLDKIAFFFREHSGKEQYVRRQIMEHLHSFKARDLIFSKDSVDLSDPIKPLLDGIFWVNYYNEKDPVSGHLDFYNVDRNVEMELPGPWGVAHVQYWEDRKFFYNDICKQFL